MIKNNPMKKVSDFNREAEAKNLHDDIFVMRYKRERVSEHPIKNDMYTCSIGLSGHSTGRINTVPYTLRPHGISIHLPGDILEQGGMSDDFECMTIAISDNFFNNLGLAYDFKTLLRMQDNPILDMTDKQFTAAMTYYGMVSGVLDSSNPYKREIIKHITCAFFYGLGYYFYGKSENRNMSNDEALMHEFTKTVQQNFRRERHVAFYADALHLSAGYLSSVVKKVSGRTATQWIDGYTILEAKALLKSGGLTVQQVSMELNFPSQSFFGKYFKRHTGMSPKEYKNA